MSRIRRSVAFSFLDRYGTTVIGFVATIVLSRLLTPGDFGIFSVAASIVVMIEVVRDFGVGSYLVQTHSLTREAVRTAFTVSLFLSLACAAALTALARPLAAFYDDAHVARIVPLLAAGFLLVPFGMPSASLLRRDMAFGSLASISLAAAATNLLATAALAAAGFGYMSLVWGSLLSGAVRVGASLWRQPCLWAFRPALHDWRAVTAFGGYSAGTGIVNVFHDTLPQLILGRVLGFGAVGLYARAAGVCQLPDRLFTNALQAVLLPALAERARLSGDLKPLYLRAMTYTTALQWPILLCLAVLAAPAVRILLGSQWAEAVPLVRIMALAGLALFPAFLTHPILVASGAVRDTLILSLISIPPSVAAIAVASLFGLQAVAATQFLTGPLQVCVALIFVRRHIAFGWGEFVRTVAPSALIAVCAAAPPFAVVATLGDGFDVALPATVLAGLGALAGWLAGLALTRHPLLAELRQAASRLPWHGLRPA